MYLKIMYKIWYIMRNLNIININLYNSDVYLKIIICPNGMQFITTIMKILVVTYIYKPQNDCNLRGTCIT